MRKEGKRKALAALVCGSMLTVALVGGSLAYLTDTASDVNVMTLGNVSIEQHEYERVVDENGNYEKTTVTTKSGSTVDSYKVRGFTQAKPLLPATGEITGWDDTSVRWEQLTDGLLAVGGQRPFAGLNNVQDKFVLVENTGRTDAYVRTMIALEYGSNVKGIIGISMGDFWTWNGIGTINVDGNNYYLYEAIYKGADGRHVGGVLPAGEYTYNSLGQVYLANEATNEDVENLDGNGNGTYDILVFSQAVQAEGFADATTALDAAFGDITTTNHPWANAVYAQEIGISDAGTYELEGDVYTVDTAYFHTQKATGSVTVNGNGATVMSLATSADAFQWEGGTIPAMSAIFSSANGSKVTVNDLTFTGTMSAVMAGHYQSATYSKYDTEFNNVDIVDAEVVSFSANVSPALCAYGKLVLNNCNVYGTTLSALDTDPKWPVYDLAVVNYSDTTVNNSKIGSLYMWNQAKVTVSDGSEVDTIVVRGNMNASSMYGLTVKAGATVGAIDLSAITDKAKVNITIEDGATVGKIVAGGTEYASIEEWKKA